MSSASLVVFGFTNVANVPIVLEFMLDIAYPVGEAISSGFAISCTQGSNFVMLYGADAILNAKSGNAGVSYTCIYMIAIVLLGAFFAFLIRHKTRVFTDPDR